MRERELESIRLLQKMQKLQEDAIIALAAVAGNEPEPTPRAREEAKRERARYQASLEK